jgi:hypothetical protein
MKQIKKGTHEWDIRRLLTDEDYTFLESLGVTTQHNDHRISYYETRKACLKLMNTDLKTRQLVSLDIIINKLEGVV